MVFNVLSAACFDLPGFAFASLASIMMTLLSKLASSAWLVVSSSFAHSVMERSKVLRNSPAYDSPWRIAASFRNGGSKTTLRVF